MLTVAQYERFQEEEESSSKEVEAFRATSRELQEKLSVKTKCREPFPHCQINR
jgi:hypothetical protein